VSLPFFFHTVLGRNATDTGILLTAWPLALGRRRAHRRTAGRYATIPAYLAPIGLNQHDRGSGC